MTMLTGVVQALQGSNKGLKATLAGALAILLWSLTGLCYVGGGNSLGAMPFLSATYLVGAITVVCIEMARGQSLPSLFRLPSRVMLAGFFGVTVYSILLISALALCDPPAKAQVVLLNYMWPIWAMLLAATLLKDRLHIRTAIAGAACGMAGILLPLDFAQLSHAPSLAWPYLMAAAGSILWAVYSVAMRRWSISTERTDMAFHLLGCAVVAGILALWQQSASLHALPRVGALLLVLVAGVGPVGLSYYCWEIAMKHGRVQLLAQLACLIPILSAALISTFYHETWNARLLPAAVLVAAGAWISRQREPSRAGSPAGTSLQE